MVKKIAAPMLMVRITIEKALEEFGYRNNVTRSVMSNKIDITGINL